MCRDFTRSAPSAPRLSSLHSLPLRPVAPFRSRCCHGHLGQAPAWPPERAARRWLAWLTSLPSFAGDWTSPRTPHTLHSPGRRSGASRRGAHATRARSVPFRSVRPCLVWARLAVPTFSNRSGEFADQLGQPLEELADFWEVVRSHPCH